jgi:hypothetical protein
MNNLAIFSGSSNKPLAESICNHLGIPVGKIILKKFSDGEISVKIDENVRGRDVFVIQSISNPANDHLMELILILDALRRASARRITCVIPYYGYGRQDRKVEPRVPISARVVADLLQSMSPDRILTMDLHADQIQGFFHIPVDHLYYSVVLVEYIRSKNIQDLVIDPDQSLEEYQKEWEKEIETRYKKEQSVPFNLSYIAESQKAYLPEIGVLEAILFTLAKKRSKENTISLEDAYGIEWKDLQRAYFEGNTLFLRRIDTILGEGTLRAFDSIKRPSGKDTEKYNQFLIDMKTLEIKIQSS